MPRHRLPPGPISAPVVHPLRCLLPANRLPTASVNATRSSAVVVAASTTDGSCWTPPVLHTGDTAGTSTVSLPIHALPLQRFLNIIFVAVLAPAVRPLLPLLLKQGTPDLAVFVEFRVVFAEGIVGDVGAVVRLGGGDAIVFRV